MAIIYNHIWHILLFSCTETDRTKIYEESDIKTNTQTSAQLSRFCRRVVLVPSVTTQQKPQAEARACIPCVSLLLMYSKYLYTLCFDDVVLFQVPAQEIFRFFVIFQVPACMPVPHNFEHNHGQGGLGMDGVVRGGASFIDIYSIPYTLLLLLFLTYLHPIHFPFLLCFTSLFFSFCCCVSCLHICAKHLFASILHTLFLQYGIQEPLPCSSTSLLPYSLLSLPFSKFDGARWYAEWNSTPITAMICSLALYEVLVYCANEDLVLNWKKMHDRVQF